MSPARGLYLARAVKILSPLTAGCDSTLHEKGQLARRRTFRRGSARIRAETRGLRPVPRGSGELPPKLFSGGLRRTSGERSADTGGLRADTGGSARTLPRTGGRVHSKNVRRQKLILHLCSSRKSFRGGRPSAAEILLGSSQG